MMSLALLPMLAATTASTGGPGVFVPGSSVRASATVTVRLIAAEVVPMSAESLVDAPQRRTVLRLADGEHEAFIVEFE